ncbi:MAG: menaquinone biosynthesis protein [Bacteroidota bacterium]|nr:menaquinone biosynthesis protein [Bacteroidota bacterium]
MEKLKISIVSYLNSLPFTFGLENYNNFSNLFEATKDFPSACADKLKTGQTDIGLIPVAELPNVKSGRIISDYCIGANGKVKTVLLVSQVPLHNMETILLDYQSGTSVTLCKILDKEFWHSSPKYQHGKKGYESEIKGNTGGVIIGDRTFNLPKPFKYIYDLSEEWKKHTGLAFTFAVWAANKKISADFTEKFNKALTFGLQNIDTVTKKYADNQYITAERLKEYLEKDISYAYDEEKKKSVELFLNLKAKYKL